MRFILLWVAVLVAAAVSAGTFAPQLNGTMMPYDFAVADSVVPWGDDMKPVFINYVARHGARFLSSAKKTETLQRELTEARSGGYLTAKGAKFLDVIAQVDSVTSGNWGALNATGIAEEQRLGQEMAAIAPDLLNAGHVEAVATYVPRVVMTMYELCHELARHSSHLQIATSEGRQFDRLLRFFTTDTAYVAYLDHGAWKGPYEDFIASHIPACPAQSLFAKRMDAGRMRSLTLEMYGVLQSLPAAGLSWHPDIWFAEDEYRACWEASNLQHYYERSVSPYSVIPARSACILLQDLLSSTESVVSGKSDGCVARLHFGHAETIMPLFALMRLPRCYYPDASATDVASHWRDWEVSPLGANLLMVLLRDSAGDVYAAFRLNGRWVCAAGSEQIVRWDIVRNLWSEYVEKFTK